MNKAKLLSTVAAALLLSAGAVSAQGMSKDTPERAPAAQQNAPAEKVAPSMKGGEHKAPQTTGQATPDMKSGKSPQTTGQAKPGAKFGETKSGKGRETTGQSPKSDADDKSQTKSMNKDLDKDKSHATGKSDLNGSTNARSRTQENGANGASSKSSQTTTERSTTTGQGAGSAARLSTEQRTKITSIIRQHKVEPAHLNVSVSVGTRIPESVHVYPLPVEVVEVYPEWRGYDYILVGDQIVIINPRTHEIVAIVEA